MAETASFMSTQFLPGFINAYRNHRCLWCAKSPEYSNKPLKKAAYTDLIQLTRKTVPGCDVTFIKRKIEILRGSFRREYKKVKESTNQGRGKGPIYQPKLWYFNLLLFLRDQEETGQSGDNPDDPLDQDIQEVETITEDDKDAKVQSVYTTLTDTATPTYEHHKRRRYEHEETAASLREEPPYLGHQEDEFGKFGAVVAAKLRRMSAVQEIYAENLINQVLFNGMLGKLQESSVVNVHDNQLSDD